MGCCFASLRALPKGLLFAVPADGALIHKSRGWPSKSVDRNYDPDEKRPKTGNPKLAALKSLVHVSLPLKPNRRVP